MTNITAYILAIDSIAERTENARALAKVLNGYQGLSDVEIVPAIYWAHNGAAQQYLAANPEIRITQGYLQRCKFGQVCATLSHIRLWKKLLASPHQGALIFEDDIYITETAAFGEILQAIPRHPEIDFLRLHLMKLFRDDILATNDEHLFVDDPSRWGFATYYLSRSGAEKLLQRFSWIDNNVDLIIPQMGKKAELNCKTVRQIVVEHHAFNGTAADLKGRHEKERMQDKMQKAASTIWTSPQVFDDLALHSSLSGLADHHVQELREKGYSRLQRVFDPTTVDASRQQVLQNLSLFKNTRPSASALHLAGFHRFPELESLHSQLAGNPVIRRFLLHTGEGETLQSIGLSDITINRSQPWHKDLLRGKYRSYLEDGAMCWGDNCGGVYKVLFYLQAGSSLKLVRGSHRVPIPLESDTSSEPDKHAVVDSVSIEPGDIVIMDIRMSHRGASEEVYASGKYDHDPRILISTAMGFTNRPLTRAMEKGNFQRLMDWMDRNP